MMDKKPNHEGLPFEIMYEILANLPVKTLIRFRCVCKSWNSLISDSSFQQEHYRRCLQQDPILIIASIYSNSIDQFTQPYNLDFSTHDSNSIDQFTEPDNLDFSTHDGNDGTNITDFSIPFPEKPGSFFCSAILICQGLACIALNTDIFVCNPATREIIALPPIGGESSHYVGFGYAASTNEFKVVRFFRFSFSSGTQYYCEIFALGAFNRRETCPPPHSFSDVSSHAPFLHGAIHFLSDSREHTLDDAIYAFDIDSEEYTTIPFPEEYYVAAIVSPESTWQCFNEIRGSLCLTFNFKTSMQIWFLKDYAGRKWVKEYIIDLPEMSSEFVWGEPLAIMGNGNILLKIKEEFRNARLYWYNPCDKTFHETLMEEYAATMYVESLLPLAF